MYHVVYQSANFEPTIQADSPPTTESRLKSSIDLWYLHDGNLLFRYGSGGQGGLSPPVRERRVAEPPTILGQWLAVVVFFNAFCT